MIRTPPRQSRILVVDDEPRNVQLLQINLKSEGHEVLTATNGAEALEQAFRGNPDLILLDIMMPGGKDGYAVCRELRANPATQFTPVIMVTALRERNEKIAGLEAGADDFVSKPFDRLELMMRVRSLLRIKHFQDDLTQLNRELEIRNELMEQDLLMAREVQEQLLPRDVSQIPGFHVVYSYIPESQVGGDFLDIAPIAENRLGIFLADAMGHGAQAALVTVLLKTALNEVEHTIRHPDQVLTHLNQRFVHLLSGEIVTYASGCYMILDRNKKRLYYSNAGHPFPLLLNRQTGECIELTGAGTGTGIGLLPDAEYITASCDLEPYHTILLFTDGLYEVMDQTGDMYGVERIEKHIIQHREQDLETLLPALLSEVDEFTHAATLPDDITIVGVELASV